MKLFQITCFRSRWQSALLLSLFPIIGLNTALAEWNPDAGLVTSLTQGATLSATSPGTNLNTVLDGNTDTSWQSGACLPTGYIARPE